MNPNDDFERDSQYGGQRGWRAEADAGSRNASRGQQEAFQRDFRQYDGDGRGTGGSDYGGEYRTGDGQRRSGVESHGYQGRDSWRTHDTDSERFGGPGQIPRNGMQGGYRYGQRENPDDASRAAWESTPGAMRYPHEQGGGMGSGFQGRSQRRHHDPDYHQWREEQIRRLDDDYEAFRKERYNKFSDEFNTWRKGRGEQGGATHTGGNSSSGTSSQSPGGLSTAPQADDPKQQG